MDPTYSGTYFVFLSLVGRVITQLPECRHLFVWTTKGRKDFMCDKNKTNIVETPLDEV
jgi:hypothetical protein